MTAQSPPPLTQPDRGRRSRHRIFWKLVNPPTPPLAGLAVWLASVHGRHASWVRNIEASPDVRIKLSGRWRGGRAAVHQYDEAMGRRFNLYARSGPTMLGIDPVLVRVELL